MNNTQKFAEVDKLANGLHELKGVPDELREKSPQHKKWKKALDALPKKDQQEYKQQKYDEFIKDKKENLKELCEHIKLHPHVEEWVQAQLTNEGGDFDVDSYPELTNQDLSNKRTVFFTFAEEGKKNKRWRLAAGFTFAHKQVQKNKEDLANLCLPETVTIDYSEYSDVTVFKNNIYAKPYKDGIMLVTDVEKGNRICIALTVGSKKRSDSSIGGKIIASIFENSFRNYGQIDWTDKRFDDQVVFYVVIPKIAKNKAARIVFKNNTHLSGMVKHFRSESQRKLPPGKFKHFYDSTSLAHFVPEHIATCRNEKDPIKSANYKKSSDHSKEELLNVSYQTALVTSANSCVLARGKFDISENFWTDIENYKNKSLEEIKQEYMRDIFPFEKNLGEKIFKRNYLKMVVLYYHTNKGTTLCNGTEINVDTRTKSDCVLFWTRIGLFELLFNVLNDKNFPLCMRNSQIINEADIFDPVLAPHLGLSSIMDESVDAYDTINAEAFRENKHDYSDQEKTPKTDDREKKELEAVEKSKDQKPFLFKNKHILQEAIENQMGHHKVPHDGVFELLHDPFFKCIRFREDKDVVTAIILDKNERYMIEVFSKAEVDFKYLLWNQMKLNKHYSEECMQEMYTKIAIVIRDSYVLDERDITMGYGGKRRPYGMNTSSEYNIYYFPRKRYRYKNNTKAEKAFFRETRTFSGTRRAHTRELPENYKPSDKQLLLAKSLDIYVPDGCTFVNEAEWGIKMTKREVRYRHTCLNDVFFYDNREVSKAHEINQLSPAAFEEYSEERVKKLGYSIKSNFEDRGIDIRAIKILDNDETEYLLVQCKHPRISNKPISPGAMRDFNTACDDEPSKYKKVKMFITSTRFGPEAKKLAEKHNIELIDGDDLLK